MFLLSCLIFIPILAFLFKIAVFMWLASIWYIWLPIAIAFSIGERVLGGGDGAIDEVMGAIFAIIAIAIIIYINLPDVSSFVSSIFDEPPKHPGAMDYLRQR